MHVDRSEDWYLQIEDVQKEDAGTYECQGGSVVFSLERSFCTYLHSKTDTIMLIDVPSSFFSFSLFGNCHCHPHRRRHPRPRFRLRRRRHHRHRHRVSQSARMRICHWVSCSTWLVRKLDTKGEEKSTRDRNLCALVPFPLSISCLQLHLSVRSIWPSPSLSGLLCRH